MIYFTINNEFVEAKYTQFIAFCNFFNVNPMDLPNLSLSIIPL